MFYDFGMIRPERLQPFASRRAFIAGRLPLHWLAFIDNVAGQFAPMKGETEATADPCEAGAHRS